MARAAAVLRFRERPIQSECATSARAEKPPAGAAEIVWRTRECDRLGRSVHADTQRRVCRLERDHEDGRRK